MDHETGLVATYGEAANVNEYTLARRWADLTRVPLHSELGRGAEHDLDEVATMSVLADRFRGWIPLGMHRAMLHGASLNQVAAAAGVAPVEAAAMWREWADGQLHLRTTPAGAGL